VCVYALICFLPSSEEEFAYTLETSTINTALLSHQWSKFAPSRLCLLKCSYCVSFTFAWGYCRLLFKLFCFYVQCL